MNLNLTILSSKLWKNTYFKSILSIAFADKAIVCFIIAIFSRVYDVKTRFILINVAESVKHKHAQSQQN